MKKGKKEENPPFISLLPRSSPLSLTVSMAWFATKICQVKSGTCQDAGMTQKNCGNLGKIFRIPLDWVSTKQVPRFIGMPLF